MLFLLSVAGAADVTRMPDAQHVEAGFHYDGYVESGTLQEQGIAIADRTYREHGMELRAAFAPTAGLSLMVGVELTPTWGTAFTNTRQMLLEPVDGGGSYLDSPLLDGTVEVGGSGLDGLWLGASIAPFSEAYAKRHRITWRIDGAVRTGSKKSNRWRVQNGGRGSSPGGTAFRITGAFSRKTGVSEPYVRASYQSEGTVTVDVLDEAGLGAPLDLSPASTAEIRGGCELSPSETGDLSIDLWGGILYRTPENLPSGILLPNVLDSAKLIPITHSDTLTARVGMGFHIRMADFLRASLGAHAAYVVPHTQEHLFDVETSWDTFGAGWNAKLVGTFGVGSAD